MKVCIKTLGCKVNTYESEFISYLFIKNGYEIVEENADIYVINTCSVTNMSDAKSRKMIRSCRKENNNSIIIVCGCHIQNLDDNERNEVDADIILGNHDKSKIIEYLEEYLNNKNKIVKIYDMDKVNFEDMYLPKFKSQTRAFLKIQDGCNNFCSYCIIPYVRGRLRSKNKEVVLKEINSLVENGTKEIVLTGIHTGMYDDNGYKLYDLFLDILKTDLYRVRLSSIEIVELNENILNLLKTSDVIASHFHIPLQSGCDKILKSMNRRYDTKYFMDRVNEIRSMKEDINLTTDVIVGFPGETEDDFNETYEFCKKVGFSKIHVFPYSERKGTPAAIMKDKVKDIDKKNRVKKLIALSEQLEKEFNKSLLNKEEEIIMEEYKEPYSIGHTSNFVRVKIEGKLEHNKIYKVKLIDIDGLDMIGKVM